MNQMNFTLKQTIQEIESWKKTLVFLQHENLLQKDKLVEILKNSNGKAEDLLEIAEGYQNQFLRQDETFRLMWKDLTKLERSLLEDPGINDHYEKQVNHWIKRLSKELRILDTNSIELKKDFNRFLDICFTEN
ncbi:MAG: hypothetical protein ACHQF0_00155 [Chitinophagales bacterium]